MKLGRFATCALFPLPMLFLAWISNYDMTFVMTSIAAACSFFGVAVPAVLPFFAALAASGMVWKLNSRLSPESLTQGRVCAVITFASVLIGLSSSFAPALLSLPVILGAGFYLYKVTYQMEDSHLYDFDHKLILWASLLFMFIPFSIISFGFLLQQSQIKAYVQIYQHGTEQEKAAADERLMSRINEKIEQGRKFQTWVINEGLSAPDIDPAADKLTVKFIGHSISKPDFVECSRENGEIRFETKGPDSGFGFSDKVAALRLCYTRSAEF